MQNRKTFSVGYHNREYANVVARICVKLDGWTESWELLQSSVVVPNCHHPFRAETWWVGVLEYPEAYSEGPAARK